jgi:hypothetical protein
VLSFPSQIYRSGAFTWIFADADNPRFIFGFHAVSFLLGVILATCYSRLTGQTELRSWEKVGTEEDWQPGDFSFHEKFELVNRDREQPMKWKENTPIDLFWVLLLIEIS